MADRKPRATREEALIAKIEKNEDAKAKLQEKIDQLDVTINDLKQQLKALYDEKKKAERAAETKAKREEKKKARQNLLKAIMNSGLSAEEIKARLGIE